ncbi:MAG: fumarate hydratase [Thermoplasmata archaeon]|nr:fumarate hydratase [Thermoplasmata archaeon]
MKDGFYDVLQKVSGDLYYQALTALPVDVLEALDRAAASETSPTGKRILEIITQNIRLAGEKNTLVCQDTGFPVYYVEAGDVDLNINRAFASIRAGTAEATLRHHLRPNMVDPISRKNTGDNTGKSAPMVYFEPNPKLGRVVHVMAMPKGSGSENMSALTMLSPAEGLLGVKRFVLKTVAEAGGKGCPPYIVGVGVGGTFETVGHLSKKALFRSLRVRGEDAAQSELEEDLLRKINELGLGPMGLGGSVTAIAVNAEIGETHISSLPVAVNIQCWRGERAEATIDEELAVTWDEGRRTP